jgi:hypothetical protein
MAMADKKTITVDLPPALVPLAVRIREGKLHEQRLAELAERIREQREQRRKRSKARKKPKRKRGHPQKHNIEGDIFAAAEVVKKRPRR